jgi:hypothetical protein
MALVQENDPHARLETLERWSGCATLLILLGILIEIALVSWFGREFWEKVGTITADALIGIGLVAEYIIILSTITATAEANRLSELKNAELTARAEEANARAVAAKLELAKLTTPRVEILKQGSNEASLISKLRAFRGTQFDVGFGADGEQAHFTWMLEAILSTAGWNQVAWGIHAVGVQGLHRGQRPLAGSVSAENVEIHIDPSFSHRLLPAADGLISALNQIGISAREAPFNCLSTNGEAIHILIGPRG